MKTTDPVILALAKAKKLAQRARAERSMMNADDLIVARWGYEVPDKPVPLSEFDPEKHL